MELRARLPFASNRAGAKRAAAAAKKGEGSRIVQTFALAGALFLIPLGISSYNYVKTAFKEIAFAEAERVGVEYLRPAQEVLGLVQRHAVLSRAGLTAQADVSARLADTAAQIRAAMGNVERADTEHEAALGVSQAWGTIKADWNRLAQGGMKLSEADNAAAHEDLSQKLISYIQDVGDRSNLILDPDLDSYYLMDITVLRLPQLSSSLGKAVSTGVFGASGQPLAFEQRLGLAVFAQPDARDGIVQSLQRAYKANPALLQVLDEPSTQSLEALAGLQQTVRSKYLQGEMVSIDLESWMQLAEAAMLAHLPLAAAAQDELDKLLAARISRFERSLYINLAIIGVALTLALALLVLLARRSAEQVQQVADENERNQAAVMRFMTELSDVAEGNLRKKITVTQELTGTIADMVNHTVEQLRGLVVGINEAAGEVAASSAEARKIASENLSVAGQQAQQVRDGADIVQLMARSIQEVSGSADRSAGVARKSISTAAEGTAAVKNTIAGMNALREQIQETSKRIKRLGESSQEIGEIVDLLSDITEQTNVLALNAAIQAASAGEAGKGFSVVAEEVQRLAERSAEAARQIGSIIDTIQNDTKDTITAMERSTQSVVDGARLSDDAGRALGEIERVTHELAELIQGIAATSQQQSEVAGEVAGKMHRVLDLTENASQGTQRTAESVGRLSELAEKLKVSVAGFKV